MTVSVCKYIPWFYTGEVLCQDYSGFKQNKKTEKKRKISNSKSFAIRNDFNRTQNS